MRSIRTLFRFPWLTIWLAPMLLLAPVYLAGKAIFWGTPLLQFAPWWTLAWQTLLDGHLPLWNQLVGMGAPLLANYQSGLLYPPYWFHFFLYAVAGTKGMAWGMAPLAAVHLAWAGVGMAFLARRLRLGVTAQAVSGLAYCLSGYLVARLGFLSINSAAAWLPWILLVLIPQESKGSVRRRGYLWLAVCLAMLLLAGHAQTAWYILLLAGIWSAYWNWKGPQFRESKPAHWRSERINDVVNGWIWFGSALLLAIGIAAPQLLPTAEYLAQSQRAAAVEYEFALNYSFWPWHLLTLIAPGLFGSPESGDYWGYANIWEDAIYIGLLPLLLALSAILANFRRESAKYSSRSLVWFLTLLFCLSLTLGLGKFTPIFPWLYRNIPTFEMFQAPARWMLWAVFALSLLAGLGAERWRRPEGWGLYWTRLGTMGAFAISAGAGLAWIYLGEISPSFIRATAVLGVLGIGSGILSLTAPLREVDKRSEQNLINDFSSGVSNADERSSLKRRLFQFSPPAKSARIPEKPIPVSIWRWGVAGFIALDLLIAGWDLNPGGSLDLYGPSPAANQVRRIVGTSRLHIPHEQEEWLKYIRFLRFNTFDPGEDWMNMRSVLLPNTQILDGIAATNNFDPLVPGRYSDWLEMLEEASPRVHEQMLRLMDIGAIETLSRIDPDGVRLTSIEGSRLRAVTCAWLASGSQEARALVLSGDIDFEREVILEGVQSIPNGDCSLSGDRGGMVEVPTWKTQPREPNPNLFQVDLSVRSKTWLVISNVWYPGWKAYLDGRPVQLVRANYLFQAVSIPEGEHSVVIIYRPTAFYAGAGVSLASMLLLAFLWIKVKRTDE